MYQIKLINISLIYSKEIFENFIPKINKYMSPPISSNIQETKDTIKTMIKQRKNQTDYVYVIKNKINDEFLGLCGLHNVHTKKPHIGIWLKISAQNQGNGKLVIKQLIAKARKLNISNIYYDVDYRNIASVKIALFFGGNLVSSKKSIKTKDNRELVVDTYKIKIT